MNQRELDTLTRNHFLLVKNIIPTEELYDLLKSQNVLPDSMVKEVKSAKTREEKNSTLVKLLPLGWSDSFRKFRQVLYLTGHAILTDQLYEDSTDNRILNAEELFSKFPVIFNQISDDTKAKFLRFLEAKMREKILKSDWENFPLERCGKLDAKKAIFETEKEFKSSLDDKSKQIDMVTTELDEMKEICKRREVEIEILRREMGEMKDKYNASVNIQGKFNAANNNTIIRIQEKFQNFNSKIRTFNYMLRKFMDEHGNTSDAELVKISTLEENIRRTLQSAQANKEIAGRINKEREAILSMLNKSVNKKQPLSEIVQKYLEKEDKKKLALFHEIEKLTESASERSNHGTFKPSKEITDMRVLKNMIAMVRVEVEHLKKKVQWKDNQITDLLQENAHLRQNNGPDDQLFEKSVGTITQSSVSPPSSPESAFDEHFSRPNLEDYIQVSKLPKLPKYSIPEMLPPDNEKYSRESTNTSIEQAADDWESLMKPDVRNSKTPEPRSSINLTGLPVVGDMDCLVTNMQSGGSRDKKLHYSRGDVSARSRTRAPLDLLTAVETSDDNAELARISEIMVENTKSCKLPSVFNGATFVDLNNMNPTSHKKFKL